jgi:serine/threonine protein kinase
MLDAVSYLHSQSICHRDLKLENWLYETPAADARLKLCDFGFSVVVDQSKELKQTVGSLFYMAPEVLEGHGHGLPCDMWSVGVIVYMLLIGVPPFDGQSDEKIMSNIKHCTYARTGRRWESLSATGSHFVQSLLCKEPQKRLSAMEAARHDWLKVDGHPTLLSWPTSKLPDVTRAALGTLAKLSMPDGGRKGDVELLERCFRNRDEQKTGKIHAQAFIQILKETTHAQISAADEKHLFDQLGWSLLPRAEGDDSEQQEGCGTPLCEVDYGEFLSLAKAQRQGSTTTKVREAFRAMNMQGDCGGYVAGNGSDLSDGDGPFSDFSDIDGSF